MQIDETEAMKRKRESELEQFDQVTADKEEREIEYAEQHYAPSEGF